VGWLRGFGFEIGNYKTIIFINRPNILFIMERLTLEGNNYSAVFLDAEKKEENEFGYTCWHTIPSMWWEGKAIINYKPVGGQVRVTFETFHRANVDGGIRDETLEESLLLVRGRTDDGRFASYRSGRDVVTDRAGVIDYLLKGVYDEAFGRSIEEFVPHMEIPLLDQNDLAERGYARLEQAVNAGSR